MPETNQAGSAQDILDFWFLPPEHPGHGKARTEWFVKNDAFDEQIRTRFGALIDSAIGGGLRGWKPLAYIVLLDQFTRNAYRGSPKSFAGDPLALSASMRLVDSGEHLALPPIQRWFVYMPFEHSEELAMQDRSVALFTELAKSGPGFDEVLDYALRHRVVIQRFGRFPHRNPILGRASTLAEAAYLAQPGSGF